MKIELNTNEAQVLLSMIDMAVKAGGLQVAEAATHLAKIIAPAAKEEGETKEPNAVHDNNQ